MMKKIYLIICAVMLLSLNAMANTGNNYDADYYSQVTASVSKESSGKGKVYISSTDPEPNIRFDEEVTADNTTTVSYSDKAPESTPHVYYLYAEPSSPDYELDKWIVTSGNATVTDNTTLTIAAGPDKNNPATATVEALFRERTSAIILEINDELLGTASITKGTNQLGQSITLTARFIFTIPSGDYVNYFSKSVKFNGWYDQNDELLSSDLVYTFTPTEFMNITAKFSWEPFIKNTDGYYFVRSAIGSNSRGYVNVISDYAPSFSPSNRNLAGSMEMVFDNSYISDPACVLRITGTNYVDHSNYKAQTPILKNVELTGQGISTKKLTGYVFELRTGGQQGFYKLYYSSANLYNAYNGGLTISSDQTGKNGEIMRLFDFEPLDEKHIDEFYFGASAAQEMEYEDGYWTSMYTAFPYKCWEEDGVEAYYVKKLTKKNSNGEIEGIAQLEKIEDGIVPSYTPVILKCKTTDPASNRLLPLINGPEGSETQPYFEDNLLRGSLQLNSKTNNKVTFSSASMRILSTVNGEVGFYSFKEGQELAPNKAWLDITSLGSASMPARIIFTTDDTAGIDDNAIIDITDDVDAPVYNLQGFKVNNLVPGQIYIKNGKKFVAR